MSSPVIVVADADQLADAVAAALLAISAGVRPEEADVVRIHDRRTAPDRKLCGKSQQIYISQGSNKSMNCVIEADDLVHEYLAKIKTFALNTTVIFQGNSMKAFILGAAMLAAVPAHAATFALSCSLKLNNQQQEWHFSFDPSAGKYTSRIGDRVVKQGQEFQVDYSYGGPPQQTPQALKLIFLATPMDYFLIINLKSYGATASSVSGSSAHNVGVCSEATFKGV